MEDALVPKAAPAANVRITTHYSKLLFRIFFSLPSKYRNSISIALRRFPVHIVVAKALPCTLRKLST